jgi:diguanylate cyclase (GGDEF)-like protein/PAS domain S-box-containing protein
MEELTRLLAVSGYIPHGYCLSWSPTLVGTFVVSDILIFLSYFSMPVALGYFAHKRQDFPYRWLLWLFSVFIMACGTTHLMGAIVLWEPMYALDALLKAVTAAISVVTAIVLWPLLPHALKLPSPTQLRLANEALQTEIIERKRIEEALRLANTAAEENSQRKVLLLAAIVESCDEAIVGKTPEGIVTTWNQAAENIFGYSAKEMIGQSTLKLFPAGLEQQEHMLRARVVHGESISQFETERIRKDGRRIDISLTVSPILGLQNQIIGESVIARDITERKQAENQIQSLAFSDPLTGLPNRRLLLDRLEQALTAGCRHQREGALLFIDVDNFKTINDTLGHDQGDLLLQQAAQRLLTCVREGGTVARVGGDEFVVLLEDLSQNPQEAATLAKTAAKEIIAALNQPYQLGNHAQHNTSSIGITLFGGTQREAIAEPLKRAELAMYQAKAAGRNTLRFFEPQMQAVVTARAAMEAGLREAIEKSQFVLHYQAQVTHAGQITGVEALVRWLDPRRGMVSPAEFIPLAEDTGLILPLGQWVLETACKQLTLWASQPTLAHLTIAVNVSARQFHQSDFVEQVLTTLERTGARASRLKLELTESLLVNNVDDVIAKMNALKGQGVGFSLDDFGTGYSSLSYLKRLPLDQLKIDQGFVRDILIDPNDAAIAKMVIALADSMGLAVIAEGVETVAQRDALYALGCYAYQGYYFSKPLAIQDFEAFAQKA